MAESSDSYMADLPHELVLMIARSLSSNADLNAFARVNRKHYQLLNDALYKRDAKCIDPIALIWAAIHNRKTTALKAIGAGTEISTVSDVDPHIKGCTPLMLACYHGSVDVLELLLEDNEVNPNSRDRKYIRPPITWAVKQGYRNVVRMLLKDERVNVNLTDKHGDTPLLMAAGLQNANMVDLLLGSGRVDPRIANARGETPLSRISREHDADTDLLLAAHVRCILNGDATIAHCQHVFYYASIMGHLDTVEYMVTYFGDRLDPNGGTNGWGKGAFSVAAERNRIDVVRWLLRWEKTDPNLRDTWQHWSPLVVAIIAGRQEMVSVLLESGRVDVEIKDAQGATPLGVAAERQPDATIIKRLLAAPNPANPNAQDNNGQTPLFTAATVGHVECVKALLEADGIRPDIANSEGHTPLWAAQLHGHSVIEDLLKNH
ncbi:uncharacterized protein N7459_000269 [Penicillium hispanicum]|uniref:uncharacterized protein n=1 Tax=Penicillium hispanicum TaxID=1080232 RepID=UPI002541EC83|nr:uncharacterized protein N7459_000269 [Penicillium hispanicum]KAJ5594061.1 hypothetical protein N7459_000269 [Penicillium hispanicum]